MLPAPEDWSPSAGWGSGVAAEPWPWVAGRSGVAVAWWPSPGSVSVAAEPWPWVAGRSGVVAWRPLAEPASVVAEPWPWLAAPSVSVAARWPRPELELALAEPWARLVAQWAVVVAW